MRTERKVTQVGVRVSKAERREFEALASEDHMRLSEWFRNLARRERERRIGRNGNRSEAV